MPIRVGVLTVSDSGAAGEREDKSGETIVKWLGEAGYDLAARELVPDESDLIAKVLAPGIAEAIRAAKRESFPRSMLSRGIAGIRGSALVVNLPGSVGGVRDGLEALASVLEHAVQIVRDEPTDH
jgi:molybdopterin biosynthesis enzyme MoaB